jgi:Ca-activated chloride channel family protein
MPRIILTLIAGVALIACADYDSAGSYTGDGDGDWGGESGATPGGAQDIGYARDVIENGGVPRADDIPIEGLFSEHDMPTVGAPCESLLCLRPALGIARHLASGAPSRFVHIGMTSGLPADLERPPLDVVIAVDKSSAMSIDMEETTEAMTRLIDKLRPVDRVAIIAFDEKVTTIRELGPVGDAVALKATIRQIPPDGSGFEIAAATEQAFAMLEASAADPERLQRIMMLSCGYPAIETDRSDRFSRAVEAGAGAGIGFSFFGVLLGHSPEVADLLGETRGGSSYYLQDLARVEQAFDTDFEAMVTPLAYDMRLALNIDPAFTIEKIYGIPADAEGAPRTEVEMATAFLSNRRGGIVARVSSAEEPADSGEIGPIALDYSPEPALGFTDAVSQSVAIEGPSSTSDEYFASIGVRIAAALVNQGEQMRSACADYHAGEGDRAIETLDELRAYLEHEAESLEHDGLATEAALIAKLIDNMS